MDGDTNIKEQLASLQRDTGRIEGKLDAFIATIAAKDKDIHTMDARIRDVEQKQSRYAGVASVLGTLGGFLVNWVIYHSR